MSATIIHGDALEVLRGMETESVDSIVTDPPYGLGTKDPTEEEIVAYLTGAALDTGGDFMGKAWQIPSVAIWRECLRVLKPGGYVFAFGGPRTFDLIGVGMRAAGFIRRDSVQYAGWVFGAGFPKSKALLKPAWEPILLCRKEGPLRDLNIEWCRVGTGSDKGVWPITNRHGRRTLNSAEDGSLNKPVETDTTKGRWPPNFVLSHVPPDPETGEGGCVREGTKRVRTSSHSQGSPDSPSDQAPKGRGTCYGEFGPRKIVQHVNPDGTEEVAAFRCVPSCAVAEMDRQSGYLHARGDRTPTKRRQSNGVTGWGVGKDGPIDPGSAGGASRYFPNFSWEPDDFWPFTYCAKASRRERNEGCDGLPEKDQCQRMVASEWKVDPRHPGGGYPTAPQARGANHHPTVKPLSLMRWLCRLITPPGGLILDPFAGSGSTLVAAHQEGFRATGIEREAEYVEIARARLAHYTATPVRPATSPRSAA